MKGILYTTEPGGDGIWYGLEEETDGPVETAWDALPQMGLLPTEAGSANAVYSATLYEAATAEDLENDVNRTALDSFQLRTSQVSGGRHILIAPKITRRILTEVL